MYRRPQGGAREVVGWRGGLVAAWFALVLLPAISTTPNANAWEAAHWQVALVSLWIAVACWAFVPRRLCLLVTYPLVLAGLLVLGADFLRGVNGLELAEVWYTFRREEVIAVLRPYFVPFGAVAFALLFLGFQIRSVPRPQSLQLFALIAMTGVLIAVCFPAPSWRAAWPLVLVDTLTEATRGEIGIGVPSTADSRTSPRKTTDRWTAHRGTPLSAKETYVLVIGESIRSDRFPGCGGRQEMAQMPQNSLTYCDVMSGADSTHVSVPLLVSRDRPGVAERIPRDATFVSAFEETGFESYWLAVQDKTIAWPDADNEVFDGTPKTDREALLPLLDSALARHQDRKLIVLHAYNAHLPYGERYYGQRAKFPVRVNTASLGQPTRSTLSEWWNDYDNAVDESAEFLRSVIGRLSGMQGEVFFAFTPDHGENMIDDDRKLTAHALKRPTWWDTRVPAVIWANEAWRMRHPAQWDALTRNQTAAVMHMDLVPTMLGAAGIVYARRAQGGIDLTSSDVPHRVRFTAVRQGETVDEQTLLREAGLLH
jgi:glucan phosphoethanolaminetransferase (alkaline phosphatase superfamily)